MFQRKSRRFRRRPNGRGHPSHRNSHGQNRLGSNSFSTNQSRNNFRTPQNPEKLLEKYNALAKEAMSSGDKTSCENFLQHADHFIRIIEDKNKIKNQNKTSIVSKPIENYKQSSENNIITQEDTTKNKE